MVVTNFPWLTVLVALPAAGAALLGFVPALRRSAGRLIALAVALVELAIGIYAAATRFDWAAPASYQLYESRTWIPQIGVTWSVAVNALGLVMILLALALVPIVLVAGWDENEDRGAYPALVLALQAFMVLIFGAYDLVVFYVAFEAMLVPLYLMIGRYGVGDEAARHKAAMKFLLYSLFGGLVMLGGIIYLWAMGSQAAQDVTTFFRIDTLAQILPNAPLVIQMIIFVTFMVAFAIKAPMVPVHTWLPDTAAVARPGTSVLLVGVLDKIGTFGMITMCLQLTPGASASAKWAMCVLAVISILWGGLSANGQNDIMRLVSYTSVSHFGFMVLGIFIGSEIALVGAMFYMVAHGVSIAAMFLLSGWLSRRGGTQDMRDYVGMQRVTPVLAGLWLMSGLASIALPGLSGFVPEYLVLMGTWTVSGPLALFAVLGVVIAAMYILMPYQRVFTGAPGKGKEDLADLGARECGVMTPLVVAMLVLGIWSAPLVSALTPVAQDLDLANSQVPAAAEGSAQ